MKITQDQITKLNKLREQAEELSRQQDELVNQAEEITQEKIDGGYTWDFILNDMYSIEELIDNLGLEVEE